MRTMAGWSGLVAALCHGALLAASPGTGRLDERAALASRAAQAHVAQGRFEPARRQFQAELLLRKQLLAQLGWTGP